MIEQPYNGRAKIESGSENLRIIIPSKKRWIHIIFGFFCMGGLLMAETNIIRELMKSNEIAVKAFLVFMLAGFTFGLLFIMGFSAWSLLGRETITIDSRVWQIEKGIMNLSFNGRQYEINSIKKLLLSPKKDEYNIFQLKQRKKIGDFWGITGGKIYFDYEMKTIKFASGLDNAEANYIINEIKKRKFYIDNE